MAIRFWNTMTREKDEFKSIADMSVGLYTCGPTVYNYPHIGNWRTYIFEDILRRHLEYRGYRVKHVMNITDVDDKTIRGTIAQKITLDEYTEPFIQAFFEDRDALNVEPATVYPKATQHVPEMVDLIKKLIDKGFGYKTEDGAIYFDISKFPAYGRLSHFRLDELKVGARVKSDEYEKAQVSDFALWKAWDEGDGEVFWETEIGKGRPGWHIECSAMSSKYLGETFDIHTGAVDNIFPHHENEIAQSEAASGKKFVNFWVHSEHLRVDNRKMSKSLGNFYTLRDVIAKGYDPMVFRYLILGSHYRSKLNFTWQAMDAAKTTLDNLYEFMGRIDKEHSSDLEIPVARAIDAFGEAMDDDLNTPVALAAIFGLIKEANIHGKPGREIFEAMVGFDRILGLQLEERAKAAESEAPAEILALLEQRQQARKSKDFATSDRIRDEILSAGYVIEDTPTGPRVKAR